MLKRQRNGSERVTTKTETVAKIASNPYKTSNEHQNDEIKRNRCKRFINTRKIPLTEAEVVESAF
jgi:hypothetical protein